MRRRLLLQEQQEEDKWNYIMCKLNVTTTTARTTVISTAYTHSNQIDYITFNEPDSPAHYAFDTSFQFTWTGERIMYIHFKQGVTTLENLFNNITVVTYIDLNELDTRNVTSMSSMCAGCTKLVQCLMSECSADNLQTMVNTFNSCTVLKWTDFGSYITGKFKPKKLVDIRNMYNWCRSITSINMSMFDLSNVTQYNAVWAHCFALTELYLNTKINSSADITTNMFAESSAANAKLYYNNSYDMSRIASIVGSNWTLVPYNY